jgi:hypothetical protein
MSWSFWMAFGRTNEIHPPLVIQAILFSFGLTTLVYLVPVVRRVVRDGSSGQRACLALVALQLTLAVIATIEFGIEYGQSQGRFLFPAFAGIGIGVGLVMDAVFPRSYRRTFWAVFVILVGLVVAVFGFTVAPAYSHVRASSHVGDSDQLPGVTRNFYVWVSERKAPLRIEDAPAPP